MFYDKDLMVYNSSFRKAWRAGNDQLSKSECENITLPSICEELDNWVASESPNPRRRLSLRASSILVNGASRLYRDETDKLLKDAFKLSQQVMLSNYQSDSSSLEDVDEFFNTDEAREYRTEDAFNLSQQVMSSDHQSDASSLEDDDESFDTDETEEYRTEADLKKEGCSQLDYTSTILQRKRPMVETDSSKKTKRVKLGAQSNSTKSTSDNGGSDHNLDGVVRGSTNLVEECNVPSNSNLEEQEKEKETRKDKAVQTFNSLFQTTGHCSGAGTGFDQNLPFGVMLIHDDYQSRIPSKILLSSLNPAVKNKLKIN